MPKKHSAKLELCRVSENHSANYNFAECPDKTLGNVYLCRVSLMDTRQSSNGRRCARWPSKSGGHVSGGCRLQTLEGLVLPPRLHSFPLFFFIFFLFSSHFYPLILVEVLGSRGARAPLAPLKSAPGSRGGCLLCVFCLPS